MVLLLPQYVLGVPGDVTFHDVQAVGDCRVYMVGTYGTVVRTRDCGTTWEKRPSGVSGDLFGLSCASPGDCWAVGDLARNVVHTADGGESWIIQEVQTSDFDWQVGTEVGTYLQLFAGVVASGSGTFSSAAALEAARAPTHSAWTVQRLAP